MIRRSVTGMNVPEAALSTSVAHLPGASASHVASTLAASLPPMLPRSPTPARQWRCAPIERGDQAEIDEIKTFGHGPKNHRGLRNDLNHSEGGTFSFLSEYVLHNALVIAWNVPWS